MLLRESLATSNCHTTMIAHVSDEPARQAETLSTAQLAARIHRLRRKKVKVGPSPRPPLPAQGSPRPCDLQGPMPCVVGEPGTQPCSHSL